jgi:hypothetical protein
VLMTHSSRRYPAHPDFRQPRTPVKLGQNW